MNWTIEKRKNAAEIYATNSKDYDIFIGEGYSEKEYKRSMELAQVIVKALNKHETRAITKKFNAKGKL